MSFSEQLKKARLNRNLSPKELAVLIGISFKTYKDYEAGKTLPRINVLKRIVAVLETTADELLEIS